MILAKNFKYRGIEIEPIHIDPKEQVSVDLAIGDNYQISGDTSWRKFNGKIVVKPKTCVLIETKETISTPNNVFGLLSTRRSLGAKGLIIANTKIDPLYADKLKIPVFNAGIKHITLIPGERFCSISFLQTEQSITGNEHRTGTSLQPVDGSKIIDFFRNNSQTLSINFVTILIVIIIAILT